MVLCLLLRLIVAMLVYLPSCALVDDECEDYKADERGDGYHSNDGEYNHASFLLLTWIVRGFSV